MNKAPLAAMLLLLANCSSPETKATPVEEPSSVPSPSPLLKRGWNSRLIKSESKVMGEIESDPRTVHVRQGKNGPLYTVTTRSGKTLAKDQTLEEIRAKDPGLHDLVKKAAPSER